MDSLGRFGTHYQVILKVRSSGSTRLKHILYFKTGDRAYFQSGETADGNRSVRAYMCNEQAYALRRRYRVASSRQNSYFSWSFDEFAISNSNYQLNAKLDKVTQLSIIYINNLAQM